VHVNLGGEPERDDSGLPPVDIEIPDDARELDRDVQAYHREQRALRRHLRRRRLRWPLSSDGMVMPLLAGCLVFALIAAVLLTVFTATSSDVAGQRSAAPPRSPAVSAPASPAVSAASPAATPAGSPAASAAGSPAASAAATAPAVRTVARLPDAAIDVGGRNLALRNVTASVLALVPPRCACAAALRQLIEQAARARVTLYLVGTDAGVAALRRIAAGAGAAKPRVADDHKNVLRTTYRPSGLTAIMVKADGSVALASGLQPGLRLASEFRNLQPSPSPSTSR
jgi:hypothetical protein